MVGIDDAIMDDNEELRRENARLADRADFAEKAARVRYSAAEVALLLELAEDFRSYAGLDGKANSLAAAHAFYSRMKETLEKLYELREEA